jgi:2-hydroxy-3-keto-5-methylthiopentenyl-1-phosphate phosphatase
VGSQHPLPVRAIVIDFDGTICRHDVSEELFGRFADPRWWDIDVEFRDGRIGARECLLRQAALLRVGQGELLAWALKRFRLDPTFPPFLKWARRAGLPVTVASDGMGFYLEPMLQAGGVHGVTVLANRAVPTSDRDLLPLHFDFPNGHPTCIGCGTCKMLAVTRRRERDGAVAFVGEGHTDRYGALYADVVFAKDHLVGICLEDGVPFIEWEDFDDVRTGLETVEFTPGPVAPPVCPGWTVPGESTAAPGPRGG